MSHSDQTREGKLALLRRVSGKAQEPPKDDSRCAVCAWPLAESAEKGCTRGNCSMRPLPDNIYDAERANREYKTTDFTNWNRATTQGTPEGDS